MSEGYQPRPKFKAGVAVGNMAPFSPSDAHFLFSEPPAQEGFHPYVPQPYLYVQFDPRNALLDADAAAGILTQEGYEVGMVRPQIVEGEAT